MILDKFWFEIVYISVIIAGIVFEEILHGWLTDKDDDEKENEEEKK